jgi:hypothetical protein
MPIVARWLGRIAGAGAAIALLAQGHVAQGTEVPPLRLTIDAMASGETVLAHGGRVLDGAPLAPGTRPATVGLRLADGTGGATLVRLRAAGPRDEAEALVRVRLSTSAGILFEGSLHELRRGSRPARLAPSGEAAVALRAWLPAAVAGAYRGRTVTVRLELRTEAAGP